MSYPIEYSLTGEARKKARYVLIKYKVRCRNANEYLFNESSDERYFTRRAKRNLSSFFQLHARRPVKNYY